MSTLRKPKLCEVLGVDVGERFQVLGDIYYVSRNGYIHTVKDDKPVERASIVFDILNSIDMIRFLPKPKLTDNEKYICKYIGAQYVTRNASCPFVMLWRNEPTKTENGSFQRSLKDSAELANIDASIFPSVPIGECVYVDD